MSLDDKLVRKWFESSRLTGGERLPAERDLAVSLGLSRAAVRNGLAALEADGHLRREVGRGTFVTGEFAQPSPAADRVLDCSPRQLLAARLAVEPRLAALAAIEASTAGIARVRDAQCAVAEARTWAAFQAADDGFHRAIAVAVGNPVLLQAFDILIGTSRSIEWGSLVTRSGEGPDAGHAVFAEHAKIVECISRRDAHAAEAAQAHHLSVEVTTILGGLV